MRCIHEFSFKSQDGKYGLDNSYTLDEVKRYYDRGETQKIIMPMDSGR